MSWRRFWSKVAVAARREAGFTLVELLWVMALSLVVFGGVLSVLVASLHQTADNVGQVSANDAVTRTLERVTREIRQATQVGAPSNDGTTITLREYVTSTGSPPATVHTIRWNCSGTEADGRHVCTRQDITTGTPAFTEITGLTTGNVFSSGVLPSGSPSTYAPVVVSLSQAIPGSTNLSLSEEVTPRNCQYAGSGYACDETG